MPNSLPTLRFSPEKGARKWVREKTELIKTRWEVEDKKILKEIERITRLKWPSNIAIEVEVGKRPKRGEEKLVMGWIDPDNPKQIGILIRKNERWTTYREALIHELIHSLVFGQMTGYRRSKVFEDLIGDELVTYLITEYTSKKVKGKRRPSLREWKIREILEIVFDNVLDMVKRDRYMRTKLNETMKKWLTDYLSDENVSAIDARSNILKL